MKITIRLLALAAVAVAFGTGVGMAPLEASHPGGSHCAQVNLHPNSIGNGQVGVSYSQVFWTTPVNVALPITTFSLGGTPPPGLSISAGPSANQVTLSGFPLVAGTYTFTVNIGATYVLGAICNVSTTYTITITP